MLQTSLLPSAPEPTPTETETAPLLAWTRSFAPEGSSVWDTVTWERRDARILGPDGPVFEQLDVEFPSTWSETARNVVASRYFHGAPKQREASLKSLIGRVCDTIADWSHQDQVFDRSESEAFRDDLRWLCLHQHAAFNSPVWFNVGVRARPQCSACFINSVEDDLSSILGLARTEGMLFKWGSGSGVNLSGLRSSREGLSGGGLASGPVAFMRGLDAMAGAIKSGGKTRRAAKMVLLDIDHPDVLEFVQCKAVEEKKAHALIDAGYDGGIGANNGAYESVAFQNANHSVRLSDAFLAAVEADRPWPLRAKDGSTLEAPSARALLGDIAEAAWLCGDPGVQYTDTIQRWHTCSETAPIRASNPCSEFVFLDDSACNLASLNLLRFEDAGTFQVDRFVQAVRALITAQDILVDRAGYPTEKIAANSRKYRPLGLGYANLGALLMSRGLAYDSDEGRALAAAITALMTGTAYARSAELAEQRGAFEGYAANRESMSRVLALHEQHAMQLDEGVDAELVRAARASWSQARELSRRHGLRNAQVSVLAPTGTIGFMMDCDTTGIEPELALVKSKALAGGGRLDLINQGVPAALANLGYDPIQQAAIAAWLETHGTVEGAPGLDEAHLPVIDCAFRPVRGTRCISPHGHLRMMAATQPFLSGAISKTVNLPNEATAEEIGQLYLDGWRMGLKAVAIYRDGSKRTQPIDSGHAQETEETPAAEARPARRRLPDERQAITHKFSIAGHEGYVTVGLYEDGQPGEMFLTMAKEGSVVSGLVDAFATSVSLALQYGVPLKVLVDKFSHMRFEPSGFTDLREIPIAKSIVDYVFRWLELRFITAPVAARPVAVEPPAAAEEPASSADELYVRQSDAPPCSNCGSLMVRSGACYKCTTCGGSSGCS
jgi:ribonucleoside-diphosphate reductase alpha chain